MLVPSFEVEITFTPVGPLVDVLPIYPSLCGMVLVLATLSFISIDLHFLDATFLLVSNIVLNHNCLSL